MARSVPAMASGRKDCHSPGPAATTCGMAAARSSSRNADTKTGRGTGVRR